MLGQPAAVPRPLLVRDLAPADEPSVDRLYRRAFDRPWPRELWQWKVAGGAAAKVLTDGDHVVGHVWYRTFPTFVDGRRITTQTYGDLMVDPQHRGRGGTRLLIASIVDRPDTPDLHLAFPAAHTVRLLEAAKRVKGLGTMTQWVRWLRGPGMRHRVSATAGTITALAGATRASRHYRSVEEFSAMGPGVAAEIDRLAGRSAAFAPCIRVRDSSVLRWLLQEPERSWTMIGARARNGELCGWAIFGVAGGHGGLERGRVVDLLAEDAATTHALLVEAARRLRHAGCTVVTLDAHDPRPWARRACRHAGFIPRGVGPHVAVWARREISRSPHRLASWYLTAADSDLV